jgi:hypothetical protein
MSAPIEDDLLANPVGVIDMTPTWRGTAKLLIVLLESGNPAAKKYAREEIERMGRILDDEVAISRSKKGGI